MNTRLVAFVLMGALLSGCAGGEIPIYVGEDRVGTFPGTGTAMVAAAGSGGGECQALALRAADPSITDAQRRAAAEYRASLGC